MSVPDKLNTSDLPTLGVMHPETATWEDLFDTSGIKNPENLNLFEQAMERMNPELSAFLIAQTVRKLNLYDLDPEIEVNDRRILVTDKAFEDGEEIGSRVMHGLNQKNDYAEYFMVMNINFKDDALHYLSTDNKYVPFDSSKDKAENLSNVIAHEWGHIADFYVSRVMNLKESVDNSLAQVHEYTMQHFVMKKFQTPDPLPQEIKDHIKLLRKDAMTLQQENPGQYKASLNMLAGYFMRYDSVLDEKVRFFNNTVTRFDTQNQLSENCAVEVENIQLRHITASGERPKLRGEYYETTDEPEALTPDKKIQSMIKNMRHVTQYPPPKNIEELERSQQCGARNYPEIDDRFIRYILNINERKIQAPPAFNISYAPQSIGAESLGTLAAPPAYQPPSVQPSKGQNL